MATLPDEMTRILEEAAEGLKALEDEVITAGFDPDDPASVDAAIRHIDDTIDAKVAKFRGNRLVEEAADAIKAECRANIFLHAAVRDTDRGTCCCPLLTLAMSIKTLIVPVNFASVWSPRSRLTQRG